MDFIPLGSTCSVAYQMQQLGLRTCAYPFDWLRVESLKDITNVLRNNFTDFVTSCEKTSESDKFPISKTDDFPRIDQERNVSIIMKNKYNMKFYHDFDNNTDLNQINEKYKRRIERFMDIIRSSCKICFVRDELKVNKLTDEMIDEFISEIHKINPQLEVHMLIIIHNPKKTVLKLNCSELIRIINDTNEFGDWFRPNVDWESILRKK